MRRRSELVVLTGFALLGALAGVAAKAADESPWRWAADLGSYPAAWVLAVASIGRFAPHPVAAALRGAVFFAAMTVAYYTWAALVLGFGWNPLLPVWLVLSASAVAGTACAAWWATRRDGLLPGAVLALAAGIVLAGGAFLAVWWWITGRAAAGPVLVHPVQGVVDAAAALAITAGLARSRDTRLWAVLLLAPSTWAALLLFDRFSWVIS